MNQARGEVNDIIVDSYNNKTEQKGGILVLASTLLLALLNSSIGKLRLSK
jgi:hypothetical protein